ncbi:MAG: ABC transporter substrate-binding protein [Clostridium fessum]
MAAQVATVSAQQTQTPVVYAAVSDPEAAELTGIDYVTGTSDALNTEKIMDMIFAANPDVKNVGLLYSLSEANSTKPIADAKAYLDEKGISYTEQTANTNDEVITAASSLVADKVDAVFTPTDNVIMAAELAIFKDLADAGIPHYAGADSFVRNGAFATCGVNYRLLVHRPLTLLIRQWRRHGRHGRLLHRRRRHRNRKYRDCKSPEYRHSCIQRFWRCCSRLRPPRTNTPHPAAL